MSNAIAASEEDSVLDEAGDSERISFASLVERHSRLVYRIALAVTRNPLDAEDAAQETFLQLYRGNRWERIEDERGYLARIAWRMAVRRQRSRKRDQSEELPLQIVSLSASPEESAIDSQVEGRLHELIDRLPEKLRQPLALAALGELKLVEVAAILGLPEGTVRRRIHTARQMLKAAMERTERRSHEQRK
jgi:RNA polymerase sigma-70 factor (ECF subfamily)